MNKKKVRISIRRMCEKCGNFQPVKYHGKMFAGCRQSDKTIQDCGGVIIKDCPRFVEVIN